MSMKKISVMSNRGAAALSIRVLLLVNLLAVGYTLAASDLLSRPVTVLEKHASAFCFQPAPPRSRLKHLAAAARPISIGFIGCGTLATAIATGLATQETVPIHSITVSKRSEAKSKLLSEAFPALVSIATSNSKSKNENQEVVDASDVVFLSVLPQQLDSVLAEVTFDKDRHTLISVVSTSTLDGLISKSSLPSDRVFKMICLPAVAKLQGVCLLTPRGNDALRAIFQSLGGCLECDSEDQLSSLMIPGALMGPMYGILRANRDWLVRHGVPEDDASYFTGKTYLGIVQDAEDNCQDPAHFDALIAEQTPGGLNEQSLKNLEEMGVFEAYDRAMDAILSRLEGRTDGSISIRKKPNSAE